MNRELSVKWAFLMVVIMTVHAAFRGTTSDLDAVVYAGFFKELSLINSAEFFEILLRSGWIFKIREDSLISVEWAFALFSWITVIFGYNLVVSFGIIAFASLIPIFLSLRKWAAYPHLGMLWFFAFCYPNLQMSAIRAGIATGLLIGAVGLLNSGRNRMAILLIILASSFHLSALAAFILVVERLFLKQLAMYKIILLISVSALLFQYFSLKFLVNNFNKVSQYYSELSEGGLYSNINLFNSVTIPMLSVYILNIHVLRSSCAKFYAFLFLCPIIYLFSLAIFPIVALRIFELLLIFQIFYISNIKNENYSKWIAHHIYVLIIVGFTLINVQVRVNNVNLLYPIFPPAKIMTEIYELKIKSDDVLYELWIEGL